MGLSVANNDLLQNGVPGIIKSIKRGIISISSGTSTTATITAVVMEKTELRCLGSHGIGGDGGHSSLVLASPTQITATRTTPSGTTIVPWELTEFHE